MALLEKYILVIDIILNIKKCDEKEYNDIEELFKNKTLYANYDKELSINLCCFIGNLKMLNMLLKYSDDKHFNQNEALCFCIKNNHVECSRLLNDESIDLDKVLNAKRY